MKYWLLTLILLLSSSLIYAQEPDPYDLALRRINEAQRTDAAVLDLTYLELDELPPEIGNLTKLSWLWLEGNNLSDLPPEIANLQNLQRLSLNGNQLSTLPPEMANLTKLCWLNLRDNQFHHLPQVLGELDGLVNGYCRNEYRSDNHLYILENPLITPPQEVIAQGTPAIVDYVRNQNSWHLQELLTEIATGIGILVFAILGLITYRRRRHRKPKQKRTLA